MSRIALSLRHSGSIVALLLAAYLVVSAGFLIWQYGWSELFADQFRQYGKLLGSPFPENLFRLDNGHRPITSNLVRLADLRWGRGDQSIGVVAGLSMMFSVLALLLVRIWRDPTPTLAFRSAATLLACIALFWLGSARMQVHGNESFQVYLVIALALVALAAVERLRSRPRARDAVLAVVVAGVASLTFGMGLATFGLLVVMMVLRRVALRWIVPTTLAAVFAVAGYVFLLPGGDGITVTVSLAPVTVAGNACTWLGSFWTSSWLRYATDAGFAGVNAEIVSGIPMGKALVGTGRLVFDLTGNASLLTLASAFGGAGLVLLAALALRAWWRPDRVSSVEALGIGLAIFATGVGLLVAVGRSGLFADLPGQILADRYLPWTNLFWLGLVLATGARMARLRFAGLVALTLAIGVAAMLYPSHRIGAGWAMAVEREVERRAAQIEANVLAPGIEVFSDTPNRPTVEARIAIFRAQRIGMFREPRNRLIGTVVPPADAGFATRAAVSAPDRVPEPALATTALPGWHIEGRLLDAALRPALDGVLIADATGVVVGLGEFSHRSQPAAFRWQRVDRIADGYDAYFRADPTCAGLILYGVDAAATQFVPLARLPDCTPTSP